MEGWLTPVILSAVLTACCSLSLSCLVVDPNQAVMDEQAADCVDDCSVELDQQLMRQVKLP